MFKRIMTGCLVALAVTMSACEYGIPLVPESRYIRVAPHILQVNDKSVTPTIVNIPVVSYTVAYPCLREMMLILTGYIKFTVS